MGLIVPFPVRRVLADIRPRRPIPEGSAEVVILPVVQMVRPAVPLGVSCAPCETL
ncbi:hypothetical protein [Ancylobacter radicis]|uniref:Uncharacterized protein n=1 Tax=Ancylobacter radicis TaxID=2836179 RepID=A0ABS5RAW3_9HYPH|nr:hypothetical protein [Ancylobacter radicis]MBS9478813.1 hypothetical protein [Ancylobacter radicis]